MSRQRLQKLRKLRLTNLNGKKYDVWVLIFVRVQ